MSQSLSPGSYLTHLHGKHIDDNNQDQKQCNPYSRIDVFAGHPIQNRLTIVVPEANSIGDGSEFISCNYSISKPLEVSPACKICWSVDAYQYIQPTAKPTPRSRKRRGNSMTGALTGIKAVISP